MSVDRSAWPLFVRVTLWGISSRKGAWSFVWMAGVCAVAAGAYSFIRPIWAAAAVWFVVAAYAYFRSLRWVEQFSSWS